MAEKPVNAVMRQVLELGPTLVFFLIYLQIKDRSFVVGGAEYSGFIMATLIFVPVLLAAMAALWWLSGTISRMQVFILMGDHEHGHPGLGQVPHDGQHLTDELGVQGGRRLVEQHERRVHAQRTCDRHALLLTAGELGRHRVRTVTEPHVLQVAPGHLLRLLLGPSQHAPLGQRAVREHGAVREEVELLEHHPDVRAHPVDVHVRVGDLRPEHPDGARRGLLQEVDAPQERGLARA